MVSSNSIIWSSFKDLLVLQGAKNHGVIMPDANKEQALNQVNLRWSSGLSLHPHDHLACGCRIWRRRPTMHGSVDSDIRGQSSRMASGICRESEETTCQCRSWSIGRFRSTDLEKGQRTRSRTSRIRRQWRCQIASRWTKNHSTRLWKR